MPENNMSEYLFEKKPKDTGRVSCKNIIATVICIAVVSGIIIGVTYYLYPPGFRIETLVSDDICLTENCVKSTQLILSSMDLNQDPCYDFYEYTCGNFINKAYEKNYPSQYYLEEQVIRNKLNAIIAEPFTGNEVGILSQQKTFYQSCMNVERIDADGLGTFQNLLEDIGGWPAVKGQEWREDRFSLTDFIINCKNHGLPFQWFFQTYYKDNMVNIDFPKLVKQQSRSYWKSAYVNLMIETATIFGATNNSLVFREMEMVIDFEKRLEAITEEQNNFMIAMSLNELSNTFAIIDWFRFLNNITDSFTISDEDIITVSDSEYIRDLNLLLAETPARVQANFIIWKIFQEFGFYLSEPIRSNFMNFTNFMEDEEKQIKTRFEFCIKEAIARFPKIAEREFIQRSLSQDKIDGVKEMISNIKNQYVNQLNEADWIDEDTKEAGIEKLKDMVEVIAEHNLNFDKKFVNESQYLKFTTDNIIDMVMENNIDSFSQLFDTEYTTQTDDLADDLFSTALSVDATFLEIANILYLTAGIVQGNIYALHRPNYLNYGSLGSIISYEIAHAFDPFANTHDSDEEKEIMADWFNGTVLDISEIESLPSNKLWQNCSLDAINSKMKCIAEIIEKQVPNQETINEKFADVIGIDRAYEAYTAWAEEFDGEQQLLGLPFSSAQMFWIQFGVINCHREIDSVKWNYGKVPLRQKVLNILKNSKSFAKDFGCPEGSVMNPIEKCHVF